MSLENKTEVDTNKYELEVSVGKDKFEQAVQKSYKKNIVRMNVPGFRKGKAPRKVVEKLYGTGVFYEDAVNDLYPQAYEQAVRESGIEPVDRADVEIESVDENGFKFKAKVTVKPEAEVKDYKGLKATKHLQKATDEEIDKEIERVRQRNARILTIDDRAAEKGDTAVIDFDGSVDGKPFEGGKAEKYELELGSGSFIAGFEDQVAGHKTGDEFDVSVTFPEDYQVEALKGKPAVFKVKLNEIRKRELPNVDDEFAKDVSEFDTLALYKEDIKKRLQKVKDKREQDEVENDLIDQVIANMKADIPEVMFEHAIDNFVGDFDYRLQMQGMNIQAYLQYTGMKMEDFRKTFRAQAERQVKVRLALEKIAELEKIEVADEDLEAEYKKLAEHYNVTADKVKTAVSADDIKKDVAVNKAIDLVRSSAVITETDKPREADKPAEPDKSDKKEKEADDKKDDKKKGNKEDKKAK